MRQQLLGDRYRLGPVIGVGGMGAVHRARDEVLGLDVAVKVLRSEAAAGDCERLRREVEYLGAVHHPNLVAILDGGADGSDELHGGVEGVAWFAMELVEGPDLRTLLSERGPLAGEAVRRVLTGVLGALSAMHAAGLVHRDVTPSNILLTAGPFARWEAKLTDLGIARRILSTPLTGAGLVVGTAGYLSPEQVIGGEIGPATDLYALALVALEALTGVTPFPGNAIESATSRLLRAPALPAGLSTEWRDLLRAATSVDPADRPDIAAFQAAVLALPEDAGVRPDRRARLEVAPSRELDHRDPGASPRRTMETLSLRSTAVIPSSSRATAVMRAAARTAQFATEPQRRPRSRAVVVFAASAAIIGGTATICSAALIGTHLLRAAAVAQHAVPTTMRASSALPRPSSSTLRGTESNGTAQSDPVPTDQAQAAQAQAPQAHGDVPTQSDVDAAPDWIASEAPVAVGVGPASGSEVPGGRPDPAGPGSRGPAGGTSDRSAPVGPDTP